MAKSIPNTVLQHYGSNFTEVETHVAVGTAATHAITLSQLDDVRVALEAAIAGEATARETADTADAAAWQAAVATISGQLDLAVDGVRDRIVVGTSVTALPANGATIPGISPSDGTNNRQWFLVDTPGTPATSGIYYQATGGAILRAPGYTTAASFAAGLLIYDDANNVFFLVRNDAVADGGGIGSVIFDPFGRVSDYTGGTFININGATISGLSDATYFALTGSSELTFSTAFLARLTGFDTSIAAFASDIDDLEAADTAQNGRLDTLETNVSGLTTTVGNQGDQLTNLAAADTGLGNRLTAVEGINATQQAAIDGFATSIDGLTTTAEVGTQITTAIAATIKTVTLTDGVVTQDGGYVQTVFTINTAQSGFKVFEITQVPSGAGVLYNGFDSVKRQYIDNNPNSGQILLTFRSLYDSGQPSNGGVADGTVNAHLIRIA